MATLLSVNVGRPRDVAWNDRVVLEGVTPASRIARPEP